MAKLIKITIEGYPHWVNPEMVESIYQKKNAQAWTLRLQSGQELEYFPDAAALAKYLGIELATAVKGKADKTSGVQSQALATPL